MELNAYQIKNPDYQKSPYTGMTRRHYIDCAKYLIERAFNHVKSFDSYIIFPTVPGKTYPQPGDPDWRYRSLEFEGLRRTMSLTGPLMHVEPDVEIKGIKLRDYYCHHLYNALTPGHPNSIPLPEELPDATYQFTCELGGLCKFLLLMPDIVWPFYTQKQKDEIAVTLSKWAHHRTTQNNWRFFNIEMLSFLKKNGYEIDEDLLKDHLLWIASYHAGNGWYLEQNYNYYTISMYNIYETVWNRNFGDDYWPEIAEVYEKNTRELMKSYPYLFGRDGYINMWARSMCYRLWVAGGFPIAFMLKPPYPLDPGWARRLCSGAILQFTTRKDFYDNDVPSLGFYRHIEYMLQSYSCAASPFTMFMPFLSLTLPENSPFWTAKENDGIWESLGQKSHITVLDKPGLFLVNHGKTGTSEIRAAKVNEENHNYNRLCYNTHFPWEDHNPDGGTAMEYCFRSLDPRDVENRDALFYLGLASKDASTDVGNKYVTPQSLLYNGVKNNVLYRQALMRRPPNNGSGYIIDLAELVIPGGTIRVDRCRLAYEHELTLGHFGMPHIDGKPAEVKQFEKDGKKVITAAIPGRQLALISYNGWDSLKSVIHKERNAETEESTVIYAYRKRVKQNPGMELMITVMLHKMDDSEWTDEELFPIKKLSIKDIMPSGSVLGAEIELKDGEKYIIDFVDIDGNRQN
ncbi:MAG: DUF2264 domain-containing protein [Caulobacteraceae bacterium]